MKIKDVRCEVYLREQPQPPRLTISDRWPTISGKIPWAILRIITDDGIEGFAFGEKGDVSEQAISAIKPELIGRDPFDREWIWQRLWRLRERRAAGGPFPLAALSMVDIALWDIAGKALKQPIYKLLGAYRDKIRIYASSSGLPSVQDYADEVISCKQQGVAAYKIHVRPEIVIEVCQASRQAGGDDMILMLDPAGRYSREQALKVGKVLEELKFYWYEEPVSDHDIEGLIMLREQLDIPICATELAPNSMYSIPEYLLRGAVDIVRCDTVISGGITPCKKIADMCNAFGMQCEIHTGVGPTANIANLHVECAIKNCEFYEMYPWPQEKRYGVKEYPALDNEGYLHVPQNPGLGVEIDWESLGKPIASY